MNKTMKYLGNITVLSLLVILFNSGKNKPGTCLKFDGTNDYVEVPHSTSLDITGAITISAWIYISDFTGGSMVAAKADYNGMTSTTSYVLQVGNTGTVTFVLYGYYPADFFTTTATITTNKWYHLAATWDGTTTNANNVKVYINGVLSQSFTKNNTLGSVTSSITLGAMKPSTYYNPLNGQLDEICIWNRALTQSEIRQNMCQKLKGNESGLMGYWRMDEGNGNMAYDRSGNGNHGTLH